MKLSGLNIIWECFLQIFWNFTKNAKEHAWIKHVNVKKNITFLLVVSVT